MQISTLDGGIMNGYLARPSKKKEEDKAPGILVIQEIFGVNQVMRDICDSFAEMGYLALCPDLFWRQEPDIQLTDRTEAEWARASDLLNGFDLEKGIEDLEAALISLRTVPGCNGKVGTVGYCLGGRLAFLMPARTNIDCAVSYYGVALTEHLNEVPKIHHPLLMHIASEDKFVSRDDQQKIVAAVKDHPKVTHYIYEGVNHAFARVGGEHYNKAAADLANQRSREFLKHHLIEPHVR